MSEELDVLRKQLATAAEPERAKIQKMIDLLQKSHADREDLVQTAMKEQQEYLARSDSFLAQVKKRQEMNAQFDRQCRSLLEIQNSWLERIVSG